MSKHSFERALKFDLYWALIFCLSSFSLNSVLVYFFHSGYDPFHHTIRTQKTTQRDLCDITTNTRVSPLLPSTFRFISTGVSVHCIAFIFILVLYKAQIVDVAYELNHDVHILSTIVNYLKTSSEYSYASSPTRHKRM